MPPCQLYGVDTVCRVVCQLLDQALLIVTVTAMSDNEEDDVPKSLREAMHAKATSGGISMSSSVASSASRKSRAKDMTTPMTKRVFIRKLICEACGCHSSSRNVIVKGPRSSNNPDNILWFIQWVQGTPDDPRGKYCMVCYNLFFEGSFDEEYDSLELCVQAMRSDSSNQKQTIWACCRREYVHVLNNDEKARYKGREKDKLRELLSNAKAKFVPNAHNRLCFRKIHFVRY